MTDAVDREISIESVRPLSLAEQVNIQRQIAPARLSLDVGGIAAATKNYSIQLAPSGATSLCDTDGNRREYPTFLSLTAALVQILSQHSGPQGLLDPTAEALQFEFDRFISDARQ